MTEREERRFAEVPRESIKLMAESTGVELSEEVAALLAEDVCYRLREATQVTYVFILGFIIQYIYMHYMLLYKAIFLFHANFSVQVPCMPTSVIFKCFCACFACSIHARV